MKLDLGLLCWMIYLEKFKRGGFILYQLAFAPLARLRLLLSYLISRHALLLRQRLLKGLSMCQPTVPDIRFEKIAVVIHPVFARGKRLSAPKSPDFKSPTAAMSDRR